MRKSQPLPFPALTLLQDIDLLDRGGDCLIYLYNRGASSRPASFQVSHSAIALGECTELLAQLDQQTLPGFFPSASSPFIRASPRQLFLGAPKHLGRDAILRWHLTTRNFFAWLLRKPIAGSHLGIALSDLLDRLHLWRPDNRDNDRAILSFAEEMGYANFTRSPNYAAAMLVFAEEQKLRDLWIEAFACCASMIDSVTVAPDFEVSISCALRMQMLTFTQVMGSTSRELVRRSSVHLDEVMVPKLQPVPEISQNGSSPATDRPWASLHIPHRTSSLTAFSPRFDSEEEHERRSANAGPSLDQSHIHPALRHVPPLRISKTASLVVAPTALSHPSPLVELEDTSIGAYQDSPVGDTPSLYWDHSSRRSEDSSTQSSRSSGQDTRRSSTSTIASSVYSAMPGSPQIPDSHAKPGMNVDVLDKGLAFDEFILPGLH